MAVPGECGLLACVPIDILDAMNSALTHHGSTPQAHPLLHEIVDITAVSLHAARKYFTMDPRLQRVRTYTSNLLAVLEGADLAEQYTALQAALRISERAIRQRALAAAEGLRSI